MNRCVEPEWLDELPGADSRAQGSRRDLRRLNQWMGHARIMAHTLGSLSTDNGAFQLVELGAGDGEFLSRVASRLGTHWRGTRATLLDRRNVIAADAALGFREMGWEVDVVTRDVFDWCEGTGPELNVVVVANLFLHHFEGHGLESLLRGIARRSSFFVALEPRRSLLSLAFSRLVGLIGCNAVTRHDAPVSVRAGFSGRELSCLWPGTGRWLLRESPAGSFSHLFVARQEA
jgi:hypothetical protein